MFTRLDLGTGAILAAGGSSWSTVSDSTKKTNFAVAQGEYFLSNLEKLKLGSWNYKSQNPKTFRHYGPMAQEIFRYFGHDAYGTIGNDTTLASADMDGIMMICLQALGKRTRELRQSNEKITQLERQILEQDGRLKEQLTSLQDLRNEVNQMNSDFHTSTAVAGKQSTLNVSLKKTQPGEHP